MHAPAKNRVAPAAVLIQKKRDGKELSAEEIESFIRGVVDGTVADYQATAFLMATFFNGMTADETAGLTKAMLESGERYDFSDLPGAKVDKHSTGGIGDKVSLVLAPLAAACGLVVPMMAGRGLGHTGGTLDKLEAISGYDVKLSAKRFREVLGSVGCAIVGQTETIAPADRKLYALRDVTATVECIPLIVGSILSKKLAEGAEVLILDIKVGSGAFMKNKADAKRLAKALIAVSRKSGQKCQALLTNMDQPLGDAVGNALEVIECIEMMKTGQGPCDLQEVTIQLCALMLHAGGIAKSVAAGRKLAQENLKNGRAWVKFQQMVEAHGGKLSQLHHPETLPTAPVKVEWKAWKKGYLSKFNSEEIGRMLVDLGGGRKKTTDAIDYGVGFVFRKKLGALVKPGEVLCEAHLPSLEAASTFEERFRKAVEISQTRKNVPKLIVELVN